MPVAVTAEECSHRWDNCIAPALQKSFHSQWSAADKISSRKSGDVEAVADNVSLEDSTLFAPSKQSIVTLRDRVEEWADRPFNETHPTNSSSDNLCNRPSVSGEAASLHGISISSTVSAEKRGRGRPKKIVEPVMLREPVPPSEAPFATYEEKEEEREENREVARSSVWTDGQVLKRLEEAVERYGHQWHAVSQHVGGGKSREQCRMRNRVRLLGTTPAASISSKQHRVVNMKTDRRFNKNKHLPPVNASGSGNGTRPHRPRLLLRTKRQRTERCDSSGSSEDDDVEADGVNFMYGSSGSGGEAVMDGDGLRRAVW
eukprot:gene23838-30113_t